MCEQERAALNEIAVIAHRAVAPPNEDFSEWVAQQSEGGTLSNAIDQLDRRLGRGTWLEPNDYEALRAAYNALAEAAEGVVMLWGRIRPR